MDNASNNETMMQALKQCCQAKGIQFNAIHSHMLLRVSALHYSARDWVSGGYQTVASAHVLRQPTTCRSEYFYHQCPRVRNLIGTERSLNRSEHRVKKEVS